MKLGNLGLLVVTVLLGAMLLAGCACGGGNSPPQIASVSADPSSVAPGEVVTLSCVASDTDGDTLVYSWRYSGPCEADIAGTGSTVDWNAAGALGTYTITVTVDDGRGGTDEGACSVTVSVPVTAGTIDVKSSPAGAKVYLDGSDTGNITPYVMTDVQEGEHDLRLTSSGYKNREGEVEVTAGETTYVNWALEEAELVTATLQPDEADGKDAYVYFGEPSNNYGSESFLFAGAGIGDELARAYLQFDLASIPAGAVVTSAQLSLYYINSDPDEPVAIGAYAVSSAWGEDTLDWPGQPDSADTPEDITSVPAATTFDWETWHLTDLVSTWIDGTADNHGVVLIDTDEATETAYKAFYSSDWNTAGERPQLVITYYVP